MRLDHLLSKEQLALSACLLWVRVVVLSVPRGMCMPAWCSWVEHWRIFKAVVVWSCLVRPRPCRDDVLAAGCGCGTGGRVAGGLGLGTLLGPEGSGREGLGSSARTVRGLAGVAGSWRDRPDVENYTVDASIFVAKLVRAHGGCLGIWSR